MQSWHKKEIDGYFEEEKLITDCKQEIEPRFFILCKL